MRIGPFDLRLSGKDKPDKGAEIGATGSSVFAGLLYEDEYNSDLQGDKAIKVYDRMRRSDGQVKAGLLACKLPLMVARWDIQPASEDAIDVKIADTVKADLLDSLVWDDFLRQALIMLDFGHMLFEKVWELRDGRYTWRKLAPRLPQSIVEWHLTDDGELDHVVQQASKGNAFIRPSIPAGKLIVFTHEKEGSNFRGISMLRAAYKHWYYKNNLYAIDGMAAERHGIGLASFTYPDQATEAQKAAIKEIGERLHAHERAYVAHPDSIGFDLKGVQGQLHDIKGSIDHHDLQIVRSILAQFMNLGGKSSGGSYALSQDQSQFFLMALQSVAKNICNTVNRDGIKEMVDYNWDVKRYPRLTVSGLDSPDVLSYAQAVATLVTAGAITADIETENELRRMVKMPFKKGARPVELIGESTAKQPIPSIESGADGQAAENIVEGAKLNGIQITASLTVLTDLIAGGIPPEVALELLVAVGIDRDKAQKMVDSCKDFKSSQVAGPATPKPMPEADAAKASEDFELAPHDKAKTLKAAEFWRAPVGVESSVAFGDIRQRLDSFEDQFVKAVAPLQKRQAKDMIETLVKYAKDGKYDLITEIDVPFRKQVAGAVESMLAGMVSFGSEQVKEEALRQGASIKAQEPLAPLGWEALIRVRSLAIANILASKMRAALSWEALRQLGEGSLDKGRLAASITDLSDRELRGMAGLSSTEALNLGRQRQASQMDVKRVTSSALMDDNTCGFCGGMDNKSWEPGEEETGEPPYADCDGRDHCRCIWVYTFSQEV